MKTLLTIIIFGLLFSCNDAKKKMQGAKLVPLIDSTQKDSAVNKNSIEEILKAIPKNIKPVLGYRFIIPGDFDGDGKKENLIEHFYSALDNKETNKFYDSLPDYAQLVALTIKKEPYSFVISDNKSIDTLSIASTGQLLGLAFLKNEGDLNGDGTDEVSYVVNWASWSNLNTWHIVTYKNKKWKELYSFPIWNWQLPDLPETFNQYGLFGLENKIALTTNDTLNQKTAQQLKAFKGLVKKIRTNKIQIIFRNDEAEEDTMMVDLKNIKKE